MHVKWPHVGWLLLSGVDCHCRPSLTVDDGRAYMTSVAMTTHQIQLRDSQLYVGGVPATVRLDQTVTPVHGALTGGFSVIVINDRSVGLFTSGVPRISFGAEYKFHRRLSD